VVEKQGIFCNWDLHKSEGIRIHPGDSKERIGKIGAGSVFSRPPLERRLFLALEASMRSQLRVPGRTALALPEVVCLAGREGSTRPFAGTRGFLAPSFGPYNTDFESIAADGGFEAIPS
jgi:hypothetical protein